MALPSLEDVKNFGTVAGTLTAAVYAAWQSRKSRKDMQTNHGKKPGEHIEATALTVDEIKTKVSVIEAEQKQVRRDLLRHEADDTAGVAMLTRLIIEQGKK